MSTSTAPYTSPVVSTANKPGNALFWLGLFLSIAVIGLYVGQVMWLKMLVTPWYLPVVGTIGVLMIGLAYIKRRSWVHGLGLLLIVALAGLEWLFVLGTALPAYMGPVRTGLPIPTFQAKFANGKPVDQTFFVGDQDTVLVFFQGHWCPFCMNQLTQLETRSQEFAQQNTRVVVSSVDGLKDSAKMQADFPNLVVISDPDMQMAKAFDVLNGFEKERSDRDTNAPTVFLVDGHGRVKWFFRSDRVISRPSVDDLLAARLQFGSAPVQQ